MRVVNQDTELVFLLKGHYLVQNAESTGHTVYSLGNQQHTAAGLLADLESALDGLLALLDIIVRIHHPLAHVQTAAVDEAGMGLGVVNNHVVTVHKSIDSGYDALISEIEEESVLFLLKLGELSLQSLVKGRLPGHHPGAHGIGKTPAGRGLSVYLADLGMVGQSEIVVETPAENLMTVESHSGSYLALQFGKCEISVTSCAVLSERTSLVLVYSFKNIHIW